MEHTNMKCINIDSFEVVGCFDSHSIARRETARTIRDQIRRGLACLVKFTHVKETGNGWSTSDRLIVGITTLVEDDRVIIDLRDPNPAYKECDSPFETLYLVDLNEHGVVDDAVIEAIADHIIDHQIRHASPCDNHPDDRCSDCHLRDTPCFGEGGNYEA
jgi:hypothetical protein